MLPFSEKQIRKRKRKSEVTKTKLPTLMRSAHWPKCPICGRPYKMNCTNCGFKRMPFGLEADTKFMKEAHASHDRENTLELFRKASQLKHE